MIERVAMPSLRMPPRDGMRKPSLTWADLQSHLQIAAQCRDEAVKTLGGLVDQLTQGEQVDLANAGQIVRRMFALLQGEPRLASLLMGRQVMEEDYLVLHELNVAWLVMATASWMGIDAQEVRDGGLGALFKDIGMLQVPDEIRLAPRPLSENERMLVEQYPIHTIDMLERCGNLSQTTLLVAFQAHERCDGTGYPRSRHAMFIHPLAKLAAVADVFSAVTCDRPYREGVTPYKGMTILLEEASRGQLDPALVRVFLDCFTLFPIGSFVRLSDDTVARVVRSNGAEHTRPVVVPLQSDGQESTLQVDLGACKGLSVVEALPAERARKLSGMVNRKGVEPAPPSHGRGETRAAG